MIDLDATRSYFDDLLAVIKRQQDALAFYADNTNWRSRPIEPGRYETGPAVDGGERARATVGEVSS